MNDRVNQGRCAETQRRVGFGDELEPGLSRKRGYTAYVELRVFCRFTLPSLRIGRVELKGPSFRFGTDLLLIPKFGRP